MLSVFLLNTIVYAQGGSTPDNTHYSKPNNHEYLEKFEKLTPDIAKGRIEYEICALCHTPEGWGSRSGRYPQIAGQHVNVIVKQLEDIRNGNRDNPTMYPFTRFEDSAPHERDSAQRVVDVATYVSKLPMLSNENNESNGSGRNLSLGKKLYDKLCVKCHGKAGEGNNKKYYPRIQGQNYHYLLRQMRWIKRNKRRNADLKMKRQLGNLRSKHLRALADYVSRLKPDSSLLAPVGWKNPDFANKFMDARKRKRRQ
jgi:cytochrome c553